jgi:hypothetical protein
MSQPNIDARRIRSVASAGLMSALLVVTLATRAEAQDPTAHAMSGQSGNDHHVLMLDGVYGDAFLSMSGAAGGSPITVSVEALGIDTPFSQWMAGAIGGNAPPMNGSLITTDFQFRPTRALDFSNGTLSEITFPALDAGGKEPLWFAATIKPASSNFTTFPSNAAKLSQHVTRQAGISSQFRLNIKGMENASQHVTKIDAMTIKPGGACPTLAVTVRAAQGVQFFQAQQSTVGERRNSQRWSGTLELLDHAAATAYRLEFTALRLVKLEESFGRAQGDEAATDIYRVEFACEKVELK